MLSTENVLWEPGSNSIQGKILTKNKIKIKIRPTSYKGECQTKNDSEKRLQNRWKKK